MPFIAAGTMPEFFIEVAALIVCGALIAYIGYRLKMVPIVGFLITGVIIGPNALMLVSNQELVDATAQIGVILLLFTIGIEFSLDKLARIKNLIFGGGGMQVIGASVLTMGILMAFGVSWQAGLFTGFLVALSSTAIVLKLLGSRGESNTEVGQAGLGLLIFQDLAIVVMVLLVPMLAGAGGSALEVGFALGKAGLIIAVVLVGARRVVPLLLERVAKTCSQELFLLSLIALCFGLAFLASLAGVSLELGAFLAGLIVSESRYSEHAFGEIMPLQILFSATFFVSVGMLLNLSFLFTNLPLVLGVVALVLLIKLFTTGLSLKVLGYSMASSVAGAFLLAQVGEFSFVLERAGRELSLFPAGMAETGSQTFIAATVLLMIATPPLTQLGSWLSKRISNKGNAVSEPAQEEKQAAEEATPLPEEHSKIQNHVIVAGYGRAARRLVDILAAARIPHVIITLSPKRAEEAENDGRLVVRGDPGRQNALIHARIMRAKMLFIPDDDPEFAHRVSRVARTLNPTLRMVGRTRYQASAEEILHAGTDQVVTEEHETIAQLFAEVLRDYHVDPGEVEHCLGVVRNANYEVLRDASANGVLAPIGDMIAGTQDTRTVLVREGAEVIGMTLGDVPWDSEGITVKSIKREATMVTSPPAMFKIKVGDQITLTGSAEAFAHCAIHFRAKAFEDDVHLHTQGVHIYGADWCPLTGGFKGYFQQHGIKYRYYNIEEDEQAEAEVKAMNNGKIKFPMVVIGERIMKNPPIDEVEDALAAIGLVPA